MAFQRIWAFFTCCEMYKDKLLEESLHGVS